MAILAASVGRKVADVAAEMVPIRDVIDPRPLCWLLATSVRKIGPLCPMKEASCQSMCPARTINAVHCAPVF